MTLDDAIRICYCRESERILQDIYSTEFADEDTEAEEEDTDIDLFDFGMGDLESDMEI